MFDPIPCAELAYVIGTVLSDGNLNIHGYHKEILLSVTDKDFAEEFSRCLTRILGRTRHYKVRWSEKRKRWIVQRRSILLHNFLNRPWQLLGPQIERDKKCIASFLKAFFDAEGCVSLRQVRL